MCLQSNWKEIVDSFDDMNLREALLRGIYAYGFEKPSAIQQRAILPCIKGRYDFYGMSDFVTRMLDRFIHTLINWARLCLLVIL